MAKNNPFGVLEFLHWNHAWNSYKYPDQKSLEKAIALMKELGAGFVRIDFLWEDIEPEKGRLKFAKYDTIVDLLCKNNLGILGLLNYSATWDSPTGKWNDPSADHKNFVNYALKVIQRYKDGVKYWEAWNEPDSAIYWAQQDGLQSYCALLKEVYAAAKAEDSGCKILNGGFANGISSVKRLYENGAKDYFDILNIHIFEYPLPDNAINMAQDYIRSANEVMRKNQDADKKIWITEIGCPGVKDGLQVKNWWMGLNPTEEQQRDWASRVFSALIKEKSVEKIFWAFFRDCLGHWEDGIDYFGLVRWDYSKKPAFFAYQNCFRNWVERPNDSLINVTGRK